MNLNNKKDKSPLNILQPSARSIHVWGPLLMNHKLTSHWSVRLVGGAFLRKFARVSDGVSGGGRWKCAFCLTRDGKAVKIDHGEINK